MAFRSSLWLRRATLVNLVGIARKWDAADIDELAERVLRADSDGVKSSLPRTLKVSSAARRATLEFDSEHTAERFVGKFHEYLEGIRQVDKSELHPIDMVALRRTLSASVVKPRDERSRSDVIAEVIKALHAKSTPPEVDADPTRAPLSLSLLALQREAEELKATSPTVPRVKKARTALTAALFHGDRESQFREAMTQLTTASVATYPDVLFDVNAKWGTNVDSTPSPSDTSQGTSRDTD